MKLIVSQTNTYCKEKRMEKTAEAVFYVTSSCFLILKIKRRIPFKNLGDSNITTFIAIPPFIWLR